MIAQAAHWRIASEATTGADAEQQAIGRLKQALRTVVDWQAPSVSQDRKQSSVRFVLRAFCRHLERLMHFEETGGFFASVSEARPCWESRVAKLRAEHDRLRERIGRLAPQLDDGDAWRAERFETVCLAIRQLLDEVERHDHDEVALLQDTLLCDVGGEG